MDIRNLSLNDLYKLYNDYKQTNQKQIIKDIENVYSKFEENPVLYKKMVTNLKNSSDKLSLNNVYEYISKSINSYTKNLLIK